MAGVVKRWRMSPKTFFSLAGIALDPSFNKVLLAVDGTFYFMNRKVFFDASVDVNVMIIEDDPDGLKPKGEA